MRRVHLLRVTGEAAAFAPLFAAAAQAGVRVGWLDLEGAEAPRATGGGALGPALDAGAERAVAVAANATVAARARKGPVRLRELVRQQFLGCTLVLVRGAVDAPALAAADDDGWVVTNAAGPGRPLSTAQLLAALSEPRPFAPAEPVT